MPKELEEKLKKEAAEKGLTGERKNAYVYGTMAKIEKQKYGGKSGGGKKK